MATKRCTATTKGGKRCRRRPASGADCCAVHASDQLDGLTRDAHERIVRAVRVGIPRELAAEQAGISPRTLYRWLARGESDDAPERFRALANDVRTRAAEWATRAVIEIQRDDAGGRNRRWLLATRFPEHFAERSRHELTGPDRRPVPLDIAGLDPRKLSDPELDELRRICRKGRRDDA